MGNGIGKFRICFDGDISRRRHDIAFYLPDSLDEGFGYSFCYIPTDPSPKIQSSDESTTTFRTISGASLSANASTSLSTALIHLPPYNATLDKASSFESSDLFSSIPLQPIPRNSVSSILSGPIPRTSCVSLGSAPVERAFLSGPIERSFISDPLENNDDHFHRYKPRSKKWALIRNLKRAISKSIIVPYRMSREVNWGNGIENSDGNSSSSNDQINLGDDDDEIGESFGSQNVQWAQGKAGEDRLQVVISEVHEWVFVGIYDGFYGPDATDYLLNNLYSNVYKELKGLLWDEKESTVNSVENNQDLSMNLIQNYEFDHLHTVGDCCGDGIKKDTNSKKRARGVTKKCEEESQRNAKSQWDKEREEEDDGSSVSEGVLDVESCNHSNVLKALSEALRKTEEAYLEMADMMVTKHPELALMGSCVLAMLMKGEDVYLMNVGDSRAVLARKPEPDFRIRKMGKDLERINEEIQDDLETMGCNQFDSLRELASCQLTMDHSTSIQEEIRRIRNEHREDVSAVINDRVKGKLKVTRAFGAGFLKQPKWNNALLGRFRIDYVGTSPYINCFPSLCHHRLGPRDKFLILSSDGLYQYFTNEEAVYQIELFLNLYPEGDPAQHLVEEVLFRAAKKADMDFHELLDIPQGERRRKYHDDVSIIIISLEGKIWHSSL